MELTSPQRQKGDDKFHQAERKRGKIKPREYQASLEESIVLYKQGLSNAPNRNEESHIYKNIGVVSNLLAHSYKQENDFEKALYNYKLSIECYCRSISSGYHNIELIKDSVKTCFVEIIEDKKDIGWITKIENLCDIIPKGMEDLKVCSLVSLAKASFNASVPLLENNNCQECQLFLRLSDTLCKKAQKIIKSSVDLVASEEFEDLMSSVKYHNLLLEAVLMIKKGDERTQEALDNSETLDISTVWTAIDYYKQAISLLKGKDLAYEAIALGQLGRIYHKIIKNDGKAKMYYHSSLELAITKGIAQKECFLVITESMKVLQLKEVQKDENDREQRTQAIRTLLAPQLNALKEKVASVTTIDLIRFITQTHPPKNIVLPTIPNKLERDLEKTFLLRFCRCYHQDKQEDKSPEWLFLAEEISKHLNDKLESLK